MVLLMNKIDLLIVFLLNLVIWSTSGRQVITYTSLLSRLEPLAGSGNISVYACVCGGAMFQQTRAGRNCSIISDNFDYTTNQNFEEFLRRFGLI